jgi:hypothetical protein
MCRRAASERVGGPGGNQQSCQGDSGSRDDSGRGGSREGGSGDSVQPAPGTS